MKNNNLVSILLITYNSSDFVVETLESIFNQTYRNIELIISDDNSTDNTIEICTEWLGNKKNLFFKYKIIQSSQNTGTPTNCNRGLFESKGKWIKIIAGDDILKQNCIEENIKFLMKKNDEVALLVSYYTKFTVLDNIKNITEDFCLNDTLLNKLNTITKQQKIKYLIKGKFNFPGCVYFFDRKKIIELGGFDTDFKRIEDGPLMIRILKKYNFLVLPISTVFYRTNIKSTTRFITKEYFNDIILFHYKYSIKELRFYNFLYILDILIKIFVSWIKLRFKINNLVINSLLFLSPIFLQNRLNLFFRKK